MGSRIASVEAVPFMLPFSAAFTSWRIANRTGAQPDAGYVLVKVTADTGETGFGEAGRFCDGEGPTRIAQVVNTVLAPALAGTDPLDTHRAHRIMDRTIAGNPYAKASVDIALFDLAGKLLGVPSSTLLGGRLRASVPVTARMGVGGTPAAVAEFAAAAAAEGYTCVKVKVGEDPARDLATVEQVRGAVGDSVSIRIDVNEGYRRGDLGVLLEMEKLGLLVVEQPLPAGDWQGLAHFAERLTVPIMVDESATGPAAVYHCARSGAADAVQIKVGRARGIFGSREMMSVAHAAGLLIGIGSMMEAGIGAAAVLQLAAVAPELPFPLETTGARTFATGDVLRTDLRPVGGTFAIPDGPGLGVDVDEDAVRHHAMT